MDSSRTLKRYRIGAILLVALILRLAAVSFGLPDLYHADEPIVVNHALAFGTGDLNPHFFKIPPLTSYLLFFGYGIFFMLGRAAGLFHSVRDFEYLFYKDPTVFYLIARFLFGVAAGVATVYLFYRLIRKYFSEELADLGAFFLAVCFLHVRDSHYIYVDIPLVLILVASFFPFFELLKKKNSHWLPWIAGAMIGLASAAKYNGSALVFPYLYLSLDSDRKKMFEGWLRAGLAALAVFIALNPFALLDCDFFLQEIQKQSASQGGGGWLHHLRYSLAGALGIPMLAASAYQLFEFVSRGKIKDKKRMAFAVFILIYYPIVAIAGQPYDRYVLPLLPFLIFFAADFVQTWPAKFPKIRKKISFALILLLALPNVAKSILFDKIMLAKDTRTVAREWIEKNIPPGSALALDGSFYMPRPSFSKEQLETKLRETEAAEFSKPQKRRLDYLLSHVSNSKPAYNLYFLVTPEAEGERFLFAKPTVPYDVEALKNAGIHYVIMAHSHEGKAQPGFYESLARAGEAVASFNPYRSGARQEPYDVEPLTGGPFLFEELIRRTRNGQPIQIYKI